MTNLPGLEDNQQERTLADYINILYRLAIGIGALVAVIKITMAGIKYMTSDAFSSKEQAKKDITAALLGLLIMLSTVVILQLIYKDILTLNVLQRLEPVKKITPPPATQGEAQEMTVKQMEAFLKANPGKHIERIIVRYNLGAPAIRSAFEKQCTDARGKVTTHKVYTGTGYNYGDGLECVVSATQ